MLFNWFSFFFLDLPLALTFDILYPLQKSVEKSNNSITNYIYYMKTNTERPIAEEFLFYIKHFEHTSMCVGGTRKR